MRSLAAVVLLSSCAPSPSSAPSLSIDLASPTSSARIALDPPPVATASPSAERSDPRERAAATCEATADIQACTIAAYAYESGDGVPKDLTRAVELFQRLCDEEAGIFPQPCQSLAAHLLSGEGIAKDPARAARIHAATCSEGVCDADVLFALCADAGANGSSNVGCVPLADVLTMPVVGAPSNPKLAQSLIEAACRRREARACRKLAEWYADGWSWVDGTSVPKDPKRSQRFLKQACDAGDASACAVK